MFAYIFSKIITTDNLNITNLMQRFENLFLQNSSTEFLDIAQILVLGYVFKFVQVVAPPALLAK